jgi:hypothetical protein
MDKIGSKTRKRGFLAISKMRAGGEKSPTDMRLLVSVWEKAKERLKSRRNPR